MQPTFHRCARPARRRRRRRPWSATQTTLKYLINSIMAPFPSWGELRKRVYLPEIAWAIRLMAMLECPPLRTELPNLPPILIPVRSQRISCAGHRIVSSPLELMEIFSSIRTSNVYVQYYNGYAFHQKSRLWSHKAEVHTMVSSTLVSSVFYVEHYFFLNFFFSSGKSVRI